MRFFLLCKRPAVSQIRRSVRRALAAWQASNTTAAGSAPAEDLTISTPARCDQASSCSMAAARKVSAPASKTRFPSAFACAAILPAVVVLPTPFTPIKSRTEGCFSKSYAFSPRSILDLMLSIRRSRQALRARTCCASTASRSSSKISSVARTPTSPVIKISSSSSKNSSSTSPGPLNRSSRP